MEASQHISGGLRARASSPAELAVAAVLAPAQGGPAAIMGINAQSYEAGSPKQHNAAAPDVEDESRRSLFNEDSTWCVVTATKPLHQAGQPHPEVARGEGSAGIPAAPKVPTVVTASSGKMHELLGLLHTVAPGTTIDLAGKTFVGRVPDGDLVLAKEGLMLRNGLLSLPDGARLVCKANNLRLSGVTLRGTGCPGSTRPVFRTGLVEVAAGSVLLHNCTIAGGSTDRCSSLMVRAGAQAELVSCDLLRAESACGLLVTGQGSKAKLRQCSIQRSEQSCVLVMLEGRVDMESCSLLSSNKGSGLEVVGHGSRASAKCCAFPNNCESGVQVHSGGAVELHRCDLVSSKQSDGLEAKGEGSTAVATSCDFVGNANRGVYCWVGAQVKIHDCRIQENQRGSAAVWDRGTTLDASSCRFDHPVEAAQQGVFTSSTSCQWIKPTPNKHHSMPHLALTPDSPPSKAAAALDPTVAQARAAASAAVSVSPVKQAATRAQPAVEQRGQRTNKRNAGLVAIMNAFPGTAAAKVAAAVSAAMPMALTSRGAAARAAKAASLQRPQALTPQANGWQGYDNQALGLQRSSQPLSHPYRR